MPGFCQPVQKFDPIAAIAGEVAQIVVAIHQRDGFDRTVDQAFCLVDTPAPYKALGVEFVKILFVDFLN